MAGRPVWWGEDAKDGLGAIQRPGYSSYLPQCLSAFASMRRRRWSATLSANTFSPREKSWHAQKRLYLQPITNSDADGEIKLRVYSSFGTWRNPDYPAIFKAGCLCTAAAQIRRAFNSDCVFSFFRIPLHSSTWRTSRSVSRSSVPRAPELVSFGASIDGLV